MGREFIPFGKEAEAKGFMKDHKGESLFRFDEITPDVLKDSIDMTRRRGFSAVHARPPRPFWVYGGARRAFRPGEPGVLREEALLVRRLELTDLCLSTEANYTRHLSLADFHTAFQDHPLALEHFPSGAFLGPSAALEKEPWPAGLSVKRTSSTTPCPRS